MYIYIYILLLLISVCEGVEPFLTPEGCVKILVNPLYKPLKRFNIGFTGMQTLRKIFKKLNKFRGVVAPPSEPPYPFLIEEKSSMISKTCLWHVSCIRTGSARKAAPRADGAAFGTFLAYTRLTYLSV